ncbi:hypothetical protein D3C71_2034260 [compost metagenome]
MKNFKFVFGQRGHRLVTLEEGTRCLQQILAIAKGIAHRNNHIVDQRGADHVAKVEDRGDARRIL